MLTDPERKKLLQLKLFAESRPIMQCLRGGGLLAWGSREVCERTVYLPDLRVGYLVSVWRTWVQHHIALSTPLKTHFVPFLCLNKETVDNVMELFDFRYRLPQDADLTRGGKSYAWLDGAVFNLIEQLGESDEIFVTRKYGDLSLLAPSNSPLTLN